MKKAVWGRVVAFHKKSSAALAITPCRFIKAKSHFVKAKSHLIKSKSHFVNGKVPFCKDAGERDILSVTHSTSHPPLRL